MENPDEEMSQLAHQHGEEDVLLTDVYGRFNEPVSWPVPTHLLEGLRRYADGRVPTGGFLRAVLENNLKEAVQAADIESQRSLCAVVAYCYNSIPSASWGSPEKVNEWLAGRIHSQR